MRIRRCLILKIEEKNLISTEIKMLRKMEIDMIKMEIPMKLKTQLKILNYKKKILK